MSTKLSDVVYECIFPGGMIPLKCKDNLAAIDHRITEIEVLASGRILEGQGRRIVEKNISAELTRKIVELRESQTPPLGYSEIMDTLGNQISADAARDRYERHVKKVQQSKANAEGYAAISGQAVQGSTYTTPPEVREKIDSSEQSPGVTKLIAPDGKKTEIEHVDKTAPLQEAGQDDSEKATIQDCQIVEESAEDLPVREHAEQIESSPETILESQTVGPEQASAAGLQKRVSDLTPSESGKISGPRIPHSEDDFVYTEREAGKKFPEIRKALAERGIQCTDTDVASRFYQVRFDRVRAQKQEKGQPDTQAAPPAQPEAPKEPSQPGAEGAELEARANPRGTPEENPEPKSTNRHELDKKIWEMHRAGKSPEQISDELCSEGYYHGEGRVRRMLIQQGAKL